MLTKTNSNFSPYRALAVLGAIILFAFLVFSPCLTNGFTNWDDPEYITKNLSIRNFSESGVRQLFTTHLTGKYHPLTLLTYMVEYHYYELDPHIYHLTNLILHLLNCLLVFSVFSRLTKDPEIALITTTLFALHPLQVEPVAWATSRKDLLYAFFYLLALRSYLQYLTDIQRRAWHGFWVFCFFACSLLSKITAVTLPFIMIMLDLLYHKEVRAVYFLRKIPYFLLAGVVGIITIILANKSGAFPATELVATSQRVLLTPDALVLYILKFLCPVNLSAFYPLDFAFFGRGWLAVLLLFGIIGGIYHSYHKNRLIFTGICFFLITITPTLHIFAVNDSLIYERFMYIPALGLMLITAVILKSALHAKKKNRTLWALTCSAGLIFCMVYSHIRCSVWRDSRSLWQNVVDQFPQAALAYNNLATDFLEQEDYNAAFALLEKATSIESRYAIAHFNKGNILARWRRYDEAVLSYTKAVEIDPHYAGALNNRANMYFLLGKYPEALADYNKSLTDYPDNLEAYKNRGMLFYVLGDLPKSLTDFKAALKLSPEDELSKQKKTEIEEKLSITSSNDTAR